ncbi:MAG: SMC-Scp complex subunit ScpB [Mycobacteriaceae bacterium]
MSEPDSILEQPLDQSNGNEVTDFITQDPLLAQEDQGDQEELPSLDDAKLLAALEAILLVVDSPAAEEALASALAEPVDRVAVALQELSNGYTERNSGIDLRYAGDGWRMYTRTEFAPYVERLLLDGTRSKLTRAALETLAVVAYRQPVTRARVSAVRGVNVDGVMRTLLARGLVSEAGTDAETGATQYSTTELFLERLGLASLTDLPALAPLLPDVDVIDDISGTLDDEPRFAKLNSSKNGSEEPAIDVDD